MASFDASTPPDISRTVNLTIYSRSALEATQEAFREHCLVYTTQISSECLLVSIMPLMKAPNEVRTMLLEFWNFFLDQSCQEKLG